MRPLLVLTLLLSTSGCAWMAWIGYDDPTRQPPPGSYEQVEGGCFNIGTQNLDPEQREAVLGSAAVVCSVFESDAFEQRVRAQSWIASCDGDAGSPEAISGADVYEQLQTRVPDFSVNPRKPWRAIAQAQKSTSDHTKNRVAIRPSRIAAWSTGEEGKGDLTNTVAHEITHLISFDFRDAGHGTTNCPDDELVSYGIGNLVEELSR